MQEDLLALNVAQLKERLREQGLPVSGKKQELVDRLLAGTPAPAARTVTDLDPASASVYPSEVLDALPTEEGGMQAFLRREGPMGVPMAGFVAIGALPSPAAFAFAWITSCA